MSEHSGNTFGRSGGRPVSAAAAASTDVGALGAAFAAHRERLTRIVRLRMTPALCGRVGPDDVVQDAFVAATRRLDVFRDQPTDGVFVWLRTLVMQALIDATRAHVLAQNRSAGREAPLHADVGAESATMAMASQLVSQLTSPTRALARGELVAIVQSELDGMSELDREVLLLRHFEGLTNGEVAHALGIHKAAATARHLRALRRLRASLTQRPEFTDAGDGR